MPVAQITRKHGVLRPLDTGPMRTRVLGYVNRGGTLSTPGMLFANRCTWAHALVAVAEGLAKLPDAFLSQAEWQAVIGVGEPASIIGIAQ